MGITFPARGGVICVTGFVPRRHLRNYATPLTGLLKMYLMKKGKPFGTAQSGLESKTADFQDRGLAPHHATEVTTQTGE